MSTRRNSFLLLKVLVLWSLLSLAVMVHRKLSGDQLEEDIHQPVRVLELDQGPNWHFDFGAAASSSSNITSRPRRSKVHHCRDGSSRPGREVLEKEFHFLSTDAKFDKEWDVIYGGYKYCNNLGIEDNYMNYSLNKILMARGFENLQPHQVWHPCMGCQQSYCNKRYLCKILRVVDPKLCYLLPDDEEQLRVDMKQSLASGSATPFVLKNVNGGHGGRGVQLITHPDELPTKNEDCLVQKYMEPHLGTGMFHRKAELRLHIAITSVFPLRAYVHKDHVITLATQPYINSSMAVKNNCMSDTSTGTCFKGCDVDADKEFYQMLQNASQTHFYNQLTLEDYVAAGGLSPNETQVLLERSFQLVAALLLAGHRPFREHQVNTGIHQAGALCFSQMRVDLGIGRGLEPFIYEVRSSCLNGRLFCTF